nr:BatD family protein [Desulfobulbaceae bacterium]
MNKESLKYKKILPLFFLLLFIVACLPTSVRAGSVDVEIIKQEAIVGEALSFALKFSLEDENEAIDVANVKLNGVALPYEVRSQSSSSFTMVVNGKTVRSSSDIVKSYIFSVPAETVGPLTLPEFTVAMGGESYRVKPITFQVLERPFSDDLQFLVTINNPQAYYYPSQVIDLNCRVLYRNFTGRPEIAEISLPILKNLSFELLPDSNPNFELIANGQRIAVQARQGSEKMMGKTYNSLGFNLKFRLMSHGEFEFANYLKMIVETGKTFRQRSLFFGSELVRETKPIFADSAPLKISVLELPNTDVPDTFNGAIGKFKIKVTPSSDTAIRVGDPVTLLIEISGRGTWEFVKSPPIHKVPAITDYFIVSQESVVGEVNEQQSVKSFSVRLRVKSKTVKEIPAIPFTYFNLASRKYMTVYSDPVPIKVFAASTTAQITDFNAPPETVTPEGIFKDQNQGDAAGQEAVGAGASGGSTAQPEVELPPLIEISDNVPWSATTENHAPKYGNLLFAVLPLGGVLCLFVIRLYRKRDISEDMAAKVKSNKAYKRFLQSVGQLDQSGSDLPVFCRELGRCVHQYLEERFICTVPHIDEQSLQPLIDQRKIDEAAARTLLDVVEEIDLNRYAANLSGKTQASHLLKETMEAVRKCDT